MKTIHRCEWETLAVGDEGGDFNEKEFAALARLNKRSGHKLFTLFHKAVRFQQYVGVIHTGRVTIEVLPKVTRGKADPGDRKKWQHALISMLRFAPRLRLHAPTRAPLTYHINSLSDWLVKWFLDEVDTLLHLGLAKTYQEHEDNERFFKGRLVVPRHLALNLVHRERSYIAYSRYDYSHMVNRAINQALGILAKSGISPSQSTRILALYEFFPPETRQPLNTGDWSRIRLNRKTSHYETPLELARLICLSHTPGVRSGLDDTFALMFDMQELFETFIGALMRRAIGKPGREVILQGPKRFWDGPGGSLRPDIQVKGSDSTDTVVLDTKWKIRPSKPDPGDLRQVYVYGQYAGAEEVILLYPASEMDEKPFSRDFFETPMVAKIDGLEQLPKTCSMATIELFNGGEKIDEEHIKAQLKALVRG